MPSRVYLDHNAASPLRPEAREAIAMALEIGANPSSVHAPGRAARAMIEDADGLWVVKVGSPLPNDSRVAAIEQRNGNWVLVTSAKDVIELRK